MLLPLVVYMLLPFPPLIDTRYKLKHLGVYTTPFFVLLYTGLGEIRPWTSDPKSVTTGDRKFPTPPPTIIMFGKCRLCKDLLLVARWGNTLTVQDLCLASEMSLGEIFKSSFLISKSMYTKTIARR